jgi:CheY-like chemotaxis protein/protein subunit release factor A
MKTLVIDDSKTIRKVLRQSLLNIDFDHVDFVEDRLFEAEDGLLAFSMLGKEPDIELLISDVNMPHLSGVDLMELLDDTDKLGQIKVIFVTTEDLSPAMVNQYKDNILGLIKKPINQQKLKDSIDKFLHPDNLRGGLSEDEYNQIQEKFKEQSAKLLKSINEYAQLEDLVVEIDDAKIIESLKEFVDPTAQIDDEELLGTSYMVLDEYFFGMGVEIAIDTKKLSSLYYKHDLLEKYSKDIELFDDENDFEFEHHDEDSVYNYFKDLDTFNFTYDTKKSMLKYFSPIIDEIENVGTIAKRYSLHYNYVAPVMLHMMGYFKKLDYSFEDEDIIKYKSLTNRFNKYQVELQKMENAIKKVQKGKSLNKEKYFTQIFLQAQHDYMLIEFAKSTMEELDKETISHLDGIIMTVKANYIEEFEAELLGFIQRTKKNVVTILNYYTYLLERAIWKSVNQHKNLKAKLKKLVHYNTKEYYTIYYKQSKAATPEDIKKLDEFFMKFKRDVVILSNDYKDSELIKESLRRVNNYNPISIATPKLLDTHLEKSYPCMIFIEDKYSGEEAHMFLKRLFKKYRLEKHTYIIQLCNEKPENPSIYVDAYIKKPFEEKELLKSVNNL